MSINNGVAWYPEPGSKGVTYQIPDGVTSIGDYAFENCSSLKSFHFRGKCLHTICIDGRCVVTNP